MATQCCQKRLSVQSPNTPQCIFQRRQCWRRAGGSVVKTSVLRQFRLLSRPSVCFLPLSLFRLAYLFAFFLFFSSVLLICLLSSSFSLPSCLFVCFLPLFLFRLAYLFVCLLGVAVVVVVVVVGVALLLCVCLFACLFGDVVRGGGVEVVVVACCCSSSSSSFSFSVSHVSPSSLSYSDTGHRKQPKNKLNNINFPLPLPHFTPPIPFRKKRV